VVVAAIGLQIIFGRAGERVATQMCVSIAAVSALAIFSGNSGIISFGHAAFMGFGAYAAGLMTMPVSIQRSLLPDLPTFMAGLEYSIPLAHGLTIVVGFVVATVTGLALLRLKDASATISTLGLLIIVHSIFVATRSITKGSQTFYGLPRITTFEVALILSLALLVVCYIFRESRWGLAVRAVRDDEVAAETLGVNPRAARVRAWILSATLATFVGAYYGHLLGAFSPREFYFSLTFSLVAMLIVGGLTTVSGAVGGVLIVTALQDSLRQIESGFTIFSIEVPSIFGLTTAALGLLILLVIYLRPEGLWGNQELTSPRFERWLGNKLPKQKLPEIPAIAEVSDADLHIESVTKQFGGLKAIDDVSFTIKSGCITGLIGPNGAGKSTLVNMLTAQYDATEGQMTFGDVSLRQIAPHEITRVGLARTFQNIRLFPLLTVRENVLVSAHASGHRGAEAHAVVARELQAMELMEHADARADALSYGARRKLEIARCLATEPSILLLDEPAAGMNPQETRDLGDQLRRIADTRGIAMLLIEHDLEFVNALCEHVVVLNRGRKIAEGSPKEIGDHPDVIEAYLGKSQGHGVQNLQTTGEVNA
jgi:branched-chain amino acid transport system permease protein